MTTALIILSALCILAAVWSETARVDWKRRAEAADKKEHAMGNQLCAAMLERDVLREKLAEKDRETADLRAQVVRMSQR